MGILETIGDYGYVFRYKDYRGVELSNVFTYVKGRTFILLIIAASTRRCFSKYVLEF